jgi:TonB family protein
MLKPCLLSLFLLVGCPAGAETAPWPERVVSMADLKPLTPLRFAPKPHLRNKALKRPVVIRTHVDASGQVQRVVLVESCGSPAHDEGMLQSLRAMRFEPQQLDGRPVDVTVVVEAWPGQLALTQ